VIGRIGVTVILNIARKAHHVDVPGRQRAGRLDRDRRPVMSRRWRMLVRSQIGLAR